MKHDVDQLKTKKVFQTNPNESEMKSPNEPHSEIHLNPSGGAIHKRKGKHSNLEPQLPNISNSFAVLSEDYVPKASPEKTVYKSNETYKNEIKSQGVFGKSFSRNVPNLDRDATMKNVYTFNVSSNQRNRTRSAGPYSKIHPNDRITYLRKKTTATITNTISSSTKKRWPSIESTMNLQQCETESMTSGGRRSSFANDNMFTNRPKAQGRDIFDVIRSRRNQLQSHSTTNIHAYQKMNNNQN
ncbi:uncharacterized protein LOC134840416 [Symsagittifera roscoffensis]|uniref:uncharacterized protein LOC134840416 n=1 Tax=Symsagittifera roscoffensis TaxID=84072 RepID=UPI00307CB7B0